jgi:diguanylate cyclase (GGDEF)-like protein
MRLSAITNWAYGVTVALTLASGATMLLASAAQDTERAASIQREQLDEATAHIAEDVLALSGLARQYVVVADPSDLLAYQREAQILGKVEDRTRHMRDAGAGAEELRLLHEALHWADALQDEQRAAIAARRSGDRVEAIRIVFGPEYERELDRVGTRVEQFQSRIDQRTDDAVRAAIADSKVWRAASEIMIGVTGFLFLCVLYFVFRRRVLRPMVKLSDVVTRLAAQDFDVAPPDYERIDEIGDMAQALRVFRENGIERQRLEKERDEDRWARDLLSRMTQRMQSCDSVGDLARIVQRFMPEVAPALAGRLYLLDPTRNAMVEASSWLNPVHSRTEFPPLACWGLRRGAMHRLGGAYVDVPCDHLGLEDGNIPDSTCLPLAGPRGTLGLLYLERRTDAPEHDLPDIYLKMVGENVSLALDNLGLRDALRDMAMADPLTGLPNRRQLETMLETQLAASARDDVPISCAMIDVDHFKRFNDEHGHDAGDAVLRAVGQALCQSVRENNLVFRYGGEEFTILMPGLDADKAAERAEEIRGVIAGLRVHHEGSELGPTSISLGVATAPTHCTPDRLLQTADAALLRAKRAGRDQVVLARARRPARGGVTEPRAARAGAA